MWPLISPASSACSSFIFALISEWPVLYMIGLPPRRFDLVVHHLRTLHFADERRSRLARQDLARVDDHQLVAVEYVRRAHPRRRCDRSRRRKRCPGPRRVSCTFRDKVSRFSGSGRVRDDDWENGRPSRRRVRRHRQFSRSKIRWITGRAVPFPASATTFTRRSN